MPMQRVATLPVVLDPSHPPLTMHVEMWKTCGLTRVRIGLAGTSISGQPVSVTGAQRARRHGARLGRMISLPLHFAGQERTMQN
jgi:hypothetical protein